MKNGTSEDSKILLNGVTKTTENETKPQRGEFTTILLGVSLLRNILLSKETTRSGDEISRASDGIKKRKDF